MILRLTEGSLAPVACLDGDENYCERSEKCPTLFVWERIYAAVNDVVDSITLADIIDRENENADNYVI
jgi:DNA-binding IscR family transcriptional regulator